MRKLILTLSAFTLTACSDHAVGPGTHDEIGVATAASSIQGNDSTKAGPTTPISGGSNLLGVTAPTAHSAAVRIVNGLEGNVSVKSGNLQRVLASVRTNLPKTTNVNSAAGYDQVQLLVYAACADVAQNGTMQSVYGVDPNTSASANQAALIAAGVRMLDKHTASLASRGPNSGQVGTVMTNFVTTEVGDASNTSKMVFMSVCIAANTAGSTLLGM